ncbi:site-specific integrase [bacterium]|nr:site-specific integrase [bacterium]
MAQRFKTKYPGVFYTEVDRIGGSGKEKAYYVRYKLDGKDREERVGFQYRDNMTPAKAANLRAAIIEGRRENVVQKRERIEATKSGRNLTWTIELIFEDYKVNRNGKAIQNDEYRFNSHLRDMFAQKQPNELSPSDFDVLRIALERKKLSSATIHACMALLKRILRYAAKRQLCEVPILHVELPKVDNLKNDALSSEQLIRLVKVLDEEPNRKVASMLYLALFTGMRRGEIFNLKWQDIDFEYGFIQIKSPKGGKSKKIPLNKSARAILQAQTASESQDYVFPGRNGGRLNNVARTVRRIREKAELPKDFRPFHGLRHTFATVLASSGKVDMYTLQKLLTHKSPQMTQRYAHLRDEVLQRASDLASDIVPIAIDIESDEK